MLLPDTRLINAPVLSLQTGGALGHITSAIIDPRQLIVAAFYCDGPHIQNTAVLHVEDIREITNMGVIVDDAETLMSPNEDLVRLQQIINFHFELMGKPVIDTTKHKLGRIQGYSVDADSFYIMKINVKQTLFKDFFGGTLLVDRTQVVEVNDHRIIVQANVGREKRHIEGQRLSPLLDNPFRTSKSPQPNGVRIESK